MTEITILQIVLIYLVVINVVTFVMYGIDKFKAKHSKWRIPEATLLFFAAIGGSHRGQPSGAVSVHYWA